MIKYIWISNKRNDIRVYCYHLYNTLFTAACSVSFRTTCTVSTSRPKMPSLKRPVRTPSPERVNPALNWIQAETTADGLVIKVALGSADHRASAADQE